MLKRDSLTAQMQELAHVLAKVKRLILEDKEQQAMQILEDTLENTFMLHIESLSSETEADFLERLKNSNMAKEVLDQLAYFMDEYAGVQELFQDQLPIFKKLLTLYDLLENEYGFISLAHLQRKFLLQEQLAPYL